MTDPATRAEEGAKLYVLMKRGLYWRPDAQGYTGVLADAGRYTAEKAAAYTRHDDPSVKAILASEADEFSPACWEETKLARRDKQLADAEASASALRDRVAVLESALRPFAKAGELFPPRGPGDYDQLVYGPAAGPEYNLSGDHLRAARTALEESTHV